MPAKKKTVFGQLTLGGEIALDWLKNGSEIEPRKIMFGPVEVFEEYNVPEWAKERCGIIAIIESEFGDQNALLISQNGVLKTLERHCAEWEANGAKCEASQRGKLTIEFDDGPGLKFSRDESKGKFAPYVVELL